MENNTDLPERLKEAQKSAKPKKQPKEQKTLKEPKAPPPREKAPNIAAPADPDSMFKEDF
jgi:hypothetical protein